MYDAYRVYLLPAALQADKVHPHEHDCLWQRHDLVHALGLAHHDRVVD